MKIVAGWTLVDVKSEEIVEVGLPKLGDSADRTAGAHAFATGDHLKDF
jgi:hypothetical protein